MKNQVNIAIMSKCLATKPKELLGFSSSSSSSSLKIFSINGTRPMVTNAMAVMLALFGKIA
ncbi:MAG TPA: hypothetical protein HA222_00310 [Candidatus Diapherotrites archaeon]|uniref:Uncharacterized protein n=1 Tax=Candidatus Iainarchaeum sp. TaxID=3101447 RepID=A0A7J4JTH4_9ARCH|nr:hypothetical protein [Candidatus Diapherotrites archaeon]